MTKRLHLPDDAIKAPYVVWHLEDFLYALDGNAWDTTTANGGTVVAFTGTSGIAKLTTGAIGSATAYLEEETTSSLWSVSSTRNACQVDYLAQLIEGSGDEAHAFIGITNQGQNEMPVTTANAANTNYSFIAGLYKVPNETRWRFIGYDGTSGITYAKETDVAIASGSYFGLRFEVVYEDGIVTVYPWHAPNGADFTGVREYLSNPSCPTLKYESGLSSTNIARGAYVDNSTSTTEKVWLDYANIFNSR